MLVSGQRKRRVSSMAAGKWSEEIQGQRSILEDLNSALDLLPSNVQGSKDVLRTLSPGLKVVAFAPSLLNPRAVVWPLTHTHH